MESAIYAFLLTRIFPLDRHWNDTWIPEPEWAKDYPRTHWSFDGKPPEWMRQSLSKTEFLTPHGAAIINRDSFRVKLTEIPKIELLYGDGFFGREYFVQVGEATINLSEINSGSDNDELAARLTARSVLLGMGIDFDAMNAPIRWDGTL